MTFSQFLNILNKRKIAILMIFALTVGFTSAFYKVMPKSYQATATMVVNLTGVDLVTAHSVRIPVETHHGIIYSRRVSLKVVENLGLTTDQKYIDAFLKANKSGNREINNYVADTIIAGLSVSVGRRNGIVKISYESTVPVQAKIMANAYVDAYIETILEMNNDLPNRTAFWFEDEVKGYKDDYEKSLSKLNQYQEENGIIDVSEFGYEKELLTQLNGQLFQAEKSLKELNLKVSAIKPDLSNYIDIVDDGAVEGIGEELTQIQLEFYRKASVLNKNHPEYKAILNRVTSLRAFYKAEVKDSYQKLKRQQESLRTTILNLKNSIHSQKLKIFALNESFEGLEERQEKVDEAKRTYNLSLASLNDLRLQAKSNNSESEISILTRAVMPTQHFKPRLIKILGMGVFFGFLLAISYALLRELVFRKVRIDDDITVTVGLPVLGHVRDAKKIVG